MPMEENIAGLRTVLAGGVDRQGGGDAGAPVVCLLHGYGASGDDLAGLWRVLDVPREVRFAFPEAPHSLAEVFGFPAYAWWHIDVERFNVRLARSRNEEELRRNLDAIMDEEPSGLQETRRQALAWIGALRERLGVPPERLILGGFSQGAMLSADLALHLPEAERPGGLMLLSGALIARPRWRERLGGKPVPRLQVHGMQDQMLPYPLGLALHEFFEPAWPGTFLRFQGGHEIPPPVIAQMGTHITRWVSSP